jgi:hypothetical protein
MIKLSLRPTWMLAACAALALLGLARAAQTGGDGDEDETKVLPTFPSNATADSNKRMIAVTGSDLTGASVLYLIDTQSMRLACYQANGGSESTQGIRFVGARRIDLDMTVNGFNDQSKYSYEEMRDQFLAEGLPVPGER